MARRNGKLKIGKRSASLGRIEALEPRQLLAAADVVQTFEDVRNNIEVEFYNGLMKGPQATADTGRGNAWDQAALLDHRLDELFGDTTSSQIVSGTVSASSVDVQAWIGAQDHSSAKKILEFANISPNDSVPGQIEFDHAWVQVTTADLNSGNPFYLDPSWKVLDRQDGIELDAIPTIGTSLENYDSAFRFDEAEYLSARYLYGHVAVVSGRKSGCERCRTIVRVTKLFPVDCSH